MQRVKSSIKNVVHSKVTDRYEETISTSTLMRSMSIVKITFLTKRDEKFQNRKRTNIEAKESFNNTIYFKHTFNYIVTFQPHTVPDDELKTCKNLL